VLYADRPIACTTPFIVTDVFNSSYLLAVHYITLIKTGAGKSLVLVRRTVAAYSAK